MISHLPLLPLVRHFRSIPLLPSRSRSLHIVILTALFAPRPIQRPSKTDIALPKATVNKFANDVAQSLNIRLTSETRELIASCCTEFVQLLSSEANDICEKDDKKTITPEHVLRALRQLGLHRFHTDVQEEYERAKADEKVKARGSSRRDRNKNANVDTEELLRKQEELFALARSDPMALNHPPPE